MLVWTHQQPPEFHPLWSQQVDLEYGMLRKGANKVRDRIIELERKGQMTQSTVIRGLITEWLPGVAEAVRSWCRDIEAAKGGPKPIAYPYLKQADPYVAALVALRVILDGIAVERRKLVGLAMEIGRTMEHEQRVRHWEATDDEETRAAFFHYKKEADKNRSTATHRRRVNVTKFNHMVDEGRLSWDAWPLEAHFRVGVALIDVIIRKTQWFELQADPDHFAKGRFKSAQYVLTAKPGLIDWMAKAMDMAELNSPDLKPTIMPPKRWNGTRQGGYWTPYVRTPRLVRFKASQENQKDGAADEYDAIDMPHVYDAIHLLQETPWCVNKRVLDVVLKAWAKDQCIGGLPEVSDRELPPKTPRMLENSEAQRRAREMGIRPGTEGWPERDAATDKEVLAWKRKATPVYRFNAKRASRMRSATATIQLAQEYADYEEFYFPHMLDFRGRIYPVPSFLQPQGNDLARGLLLFGDAAPITTENGGAGWLAIHLASCWGNDKWDFDSRIAWVEENEAMWRRIAADPMGSLEWSKADKPYQTLAAIFEWVAYLDEGEGFMSRLPVSVDGTCNGIQHLSAITRDKTSGAYVNLLPADKPQDIYKFVAEELQPTIERIEKAGGAEGEKAGYWLDLCGRDLPRGLTKRQVMVLPYGGTKDSYFTYTRAWLDEFDPAPETTDDEEADKLANEARNGRIVFMANHMWDTVNSVVKPAMKVMKWLQDCARAVAIEDQPIYWEVPSGFVVRHFYGLDRRMVCEIMLDGVRHQITRAEKTAKLSVKEQVQGIAPNFIHALDAAALVECLRLCREAGITSFASVHDAYGTHAANMWPLAGMLRQAFVNTHQNDVLAHFRLACQRVLISALVVKNNMDPLEATEKADEMLPEPLEKGDLDLQDVLLSDYFFA